MNRLARLGPSLFAVLFAMIFVGTIVKQPVIMQKAPLLSEKLSEEENLAGMLQDTASGVMVQIRSNQTSGSGVIYKEEADYLVVVTAAHVLEENQGTVWVVFCDGWAVECSEYTVNQSTDVAFIYVPFTEIPEEHLAQYFYANIDKESFDNLQAGDSVILMGAGSSVAEKAYEGVVLEPWIYMEDFGQYMLWARVEALPGMSGGGLFDSRGHFIGILCGGAEDGDVAVAPLSAIIAEAQ